MKAPAFWYPKDGGIAASAYALWPLSLLWRLGDGIARSLKTVERADRPVVCIGNISAGGSGKTPLTAMLAARLSAQGVTPGLLYRGYGGALKGPVLVETAHTAEDAGDEALMQARAGYLTVISRRRPDGARALVEAGADVILMDDGFQNPSLAKDLSLLVVDASAGFGNGMVHPAGPLREPVPAALARADAVVVMLSEGMRFQDALARLPELKAYRGVVAGARVVCSNPPPADRPYAAFAGIGRPEKLFETARGLGLRLEETLSFPDHHPYTAQDLELLRAQIEAGRTLLTTAKDAARLPQDLPVTVLSVTARLDDPGALDALMRRGGILPGQAGSNQGSGPATMNLV